jgi:predicted phage terminase large subunit-like protein
LSVGGSITGRGADFIIIDDPLKAEDGASVTARANVIAWYDGTLSTRLNDKQRGVIIVVMQRLHQEDLAGYLIERGGWHQLNLPAIAMDDQSVQFGPDDWHHRREGEVLHPERESRDTLERIKKEIGSLQFSAQYQQSPVPMEGNLIKREWLRFYKIAPQLGPAVRIVQSWDVASATGERNDYSVCTTWAIIQNNFYLLDVWRDRLEFPDLKRKIVCQALDHGAQTVLIEKAGLGLQLVQELKRSNVPGFPNPIGITPEGDKILRMEAQTPRIEAGHVFLPEEEPWLGVLLEELLAFPRGKHDDQVDSVSQFLKWAWASASRTAGMVAAPVLINLEDDWQP